MTFVDLANLPDAVNCRLVVKTADQCIARICWQNNDTSGTNDIGRFFYQPVLWIDWMNFQILTGHFNFPLWCPVIGHWHFAGLQSVFQSADGTQTALPDRYGR